MAAYVGDFISRINQPLSIFGIELNSAIKKQIHRCAIAKLIQYDTKYQTKILIEPVEEYKRKKQQ